MHHFLRVCAQQCLQVQWSLGGGVFISPSLAYADGYVAPDGNIYYGYKSDSNYSKERFKIEVHYYSNKEDADNDENRDPLGKFVRVKYTANLNSADNSFDKWAFRPMWWYGVPAGLTNVHNIIYSRFEKYTDAGTPSTSQPSAPGIRKDSDNVTKHYKDAKDWKSISRFYVEDPSKLTSMNGLKTLIGIDGKKNAGYDGNTADNWADFYAASKGMQGMFIDWESAGKRFYEMTYVAEMTDDAWKNRDEHPLRFAAGVYRFAGNWHIATGQIHRAPKIADSLKVKYPALTPVAKADALNATEKTSVEGAIKKANDENTTKHFTELLEKIDVANDGTATLTFHDNTTITMPGKLLVVEEKKDNVKFPPVYPAPIGVVKPESLSDADKQAIIKGFKDANKDKEFLNKVSKTDSEAYKFDNAKQTLTITYTDGSTITVPYSSLVYQGATIADWAPYVVPSPIEVENPSSLSEKEKKTVTDAFDQANADLDVYTAAKKEGKTPVSFDKDFKNAIITWADGSTSKIPSWQFLKKKPVTPAPNPQPPTPAAEKNTFTVDVPERIPSVKFDPFNATQKDIDDNQQQLNTLKTVLKKCAAKDAKDGSTAVTIKDVEYAIVNGKGVIKFHADNYEDAVYPMSVFFKQQANQQTPQTPSTETKTYIDPDNQKIAFKYNVTKTETEGDTPTVQEAVKALKQFVKDNYDNVSEDDLATVADSVDVKKTWTPKAGTKNMGPYGVPGNNGGPMLSISLRDDNGIKVIGRPWADNDDGGDWDSALQTELITIQAKDLYVKKSGAQQQDNTLDKLKQQAKDLLKKRTETDKLTNNDLKRAGIDASDNTINGMNDEKTLRELIRKLTDAKKAEYKYNTNPYEVNNPTAQPTDNDFQAAVKQFLKANYEDSSATEKIDSLTFDANSATLTGKGWTQKAGTSCLELNSDTVTYGITTVSINGDAKSVDFKNGDTVLFTVSATDLYKKKPVAPEPAPTPDALAQMKEDAKKIIDRNPNLTPDQKKQFKDKIDQANDQKGIQDILNDANNKGKENKNNTTDPNIQQTINDNKNGGKEKKDQELKAAKEAAKQAIENLPNLSEEEKNTLKEKVSNATSIDGENGVNSVLDEAKKRNELEGVKKEAKEEAKQLYFLDHGTGADGNTADTHTEDAALNSVLGSTPAEDSKLKTLLDDLKDDSTATADDIRKALEEAKKANVENTQKAKDAATKKLEEKKDALKNAYDALTPDQQNTAKTAYEAAIQAIDDAESAVKSATKPSEIKTALESVKDETINAANQAIEAAKPKHDASGNTNDNAAALEKEKKEQIDRINESDLPADKKEAANNEIKDAKKLGDPTGIANRYLKAKKIDDALKAIDDFKHLNNAQKDAFKAILKDTDASDHKNDDGSTSDDIDDVLAKAANTDNAMARLESLKIIAEEFAKGEKYKGANDTLKKAFDDASTAAGSVLDKAKGADKGADEVNTLYDDLLKAMRAIDPNVKSAGLKTDALQAEIDSDNAYKPSETEPKTPGNPVYNTSSKEKKAEFDKALGEAQTVLNGAATADISTADKESAEQKEIDAALEKLVKARLALDGVDTTDLQNEIGQESATTSSDAYKYDSEEKQNAYNNALKAAKKLIEQLTSDNHQQDPSQGDAQKPKTQAEKQKAVNEALANLQAARKALQGVAPSNSGSGDSGSTGVSDSEPTTVDKSELNLQIDSTESDSKDGNAGTSGTSSNNASGEGNSNAIKKAVEDSKEVKEADSKVAQAQANLDAALEEAKKVYEDPQATQAQVDAATLKLKTARKALEDAKANAAKVRADVLKKLLKSKKLSKTGSNVSVIAMFASMISIAAGAIFVSKRRGISRHSNK